MKLRVPGSRSGPGPILGAILDAFFGHFLGAFGTPLGALGLPLGSLWLDLGPLGTFGSSGGALGFLI